MPLGTQQGNNDISSERVLNLLIKTQAKKKQKQVISYVSICIFKITRSSTLLSIVDVLYLLLLCFDHHSKSHPDFLKTFFFY